jgi:hypothetical protein
MKFYLLILLTFCIIVHSYNPILNSNHVTLNKQIKSIAPKLLLGVLISFGTISYTDARHFNTYALSKEATSIFVGEYNDPNHPGCLRKISVKGKEVTIIGSDNLDGENQWKIQATEDFPGTIFVDFSPKGGPQNLLG